MTQQTHAAIRQQLRELLDTLNCDAAFTAEHAAAAAEYVTRTMAAGANPGALLTLDELMALATGTGPATAPITPLPAEDVQLGAVVEYHDGGLMIVATASTERIPYTGRRRILHGAVLTLPTSNPEGPWQIGGPAEAMSTPRGRLAVHGQCPAPDRCPCTVHVSRRLHS